MKSTDLRLGNLVLLGPEKVLKQVNHSVIAYMAIAEGIGDVHPFYPIELTQEWLERFGFSDKEYKAGYIGIDINHHSFVLQKPNFMGEWQTFFTFELRQYQFSTVQFVHQLQNLFYALEGEDLVFNKPAST